MPSRKVV